MKSACFFLTAAALLSTSMAIAVSGAAEGFAKGVTGGGKAAAVYPKTNDELVSYLGDSTARVIVLEKTFDFTGTQGTTSGTGCAPWGTGSGCQVAINQNGWCQHYEPNAPATAVKYDNAGILGITVNSKKTILGSGTSGIIKGKGLRIVGGASNIIIQNIHITDINPRYVWGGDAITLDGADLVWIDHVKTSLIGRQHIVLGNSADNRVTISNNEIDGVSNYSATCDGHHYWAMYFTGSNDMVTLKGNYIHDTSGRSPKVAGNTLLHAVNNYWENNSGHAFEVDAGTSIVAEGNAFQSVVAPLQQGDTAPIFTAATASADKACKANLGRVCQSNDLDSSGTFKSTSSTSLLSNFKGKNIAAAAAAGGVAASVVQNAGFGVI